MGKLAFAVPSTFASGLALYWLLFSGMLPGPEDKYKGEKDRRVLGVSATFNLAESPSDAFYP